MNRWIVAVFVAWVACASSSPRQGPEALWLWAWERPEHLEFLADTEIGVAYLAATLVLHEDRIEFRPRRQPLRVAPDTPLAGVFRIELHASPGVAPGDERLETLVAHIVRVSEDAKLARLQLDFDARRSERGFYARLVGALRQRLPADTHLGITALASWCFGDPWLSSFDGLIDEVVPMVFTMGREGSLIRRELANDVFPERRCRDAVGVRLDEAMVPLGGYRSVYAFSAAPWTPTALQGLRRRLGGASRS